MKNAPTSQISFIKSSEVTYLTTAKDVPDTPHWNSNNNVKIRVFGVLKYCAIALPTQCRNNVKIRVFNVWKYCAITMHAQCSSNVEIRVFSVLQHWVIVVDETVIITF